MHKVGLLITTWNRHGYLKKCLDSLSNADLSKIDEILIVDDNSDHEAYSLMESFVFGKPKWNLYRKRQNKGIKDSLLKGFGSFFDKGMDLVINLDGDMVVRHDFVEKLLDAKERFPDLLLTGFNCETLNKDGSIRHKVLYTDGVFKFRRTVGGCNLVINKEQYYKWVRPALTMDGNWDFNTCMNSSAESLPVCVLTPSVCNHIGFESSMGHSQGGEPPDTAEDFIELEELKLLTDYIYKLDLRQVTLIGVDCVDINRLLKIADKACEEIEFGAVKMLSSLPSNDPRVIKIRAINSKEDYSQFMLKEVVDYIDTSHLLIIQHDGVLQNPQAWNPEWLEYDFIGAVWHFGDPNHPVGNGGFALNTKRLRQITKDDQEIYPMNEHGVNFHKEEDHVICRIFGNYLRTKYGIKFAPIEVAEKFSIEGWGNPDPVYRSQFGYHGNKVIFK